VNKPTLDQIYEKFINGDPLTNDDLAIGISGFDTLAAIARQAGPAFSLAAREATRVVIALEDFEAARKRK
jgi:hypothetical protein